VRIVSVVRRSLGSRRSGGSNACLRIRLGSNLFRAVRIVLVRQDEVDAFGGFTFVTDGDVEFISRLGGSRESNNQFVSGNFEFCWGFVESHALDVEADGVESDFAAAVAQNRKRVRDFAENFFLVDVEAQGNLECCKS